MSSRIKCMYSVVLGKYFEGFGIACGRRDHKKCRAASIFIGALFLKNSLSFASQIVERLNGLSV